MPNPKHGRRSRGKAPATTKQSGRGVPLTGEDRHQRVLDSMEEGFCVVQMLFDPAGRPVDWRYLETNPAFERQTGWTDVRGRTIRELLPDLEQRWIDELGHVALTGDARQFTGYAASLRRWFDVRAFSPGDPERCHVAVLFSDVTERKQAEEAIHERHRQQRLLAELGELDARLSTGRELLTGAARILANALGIPRAGFAEVDGRTGTGRVTAEYRDAAVSIEDALEMGAAVAALCRGTAAPGTIMTVCDTAADPRTAEHHTSSFASRDVRALVGLPIGRTPDATTMLFVADRVARSWTAAECELIRIAGERVWMLMQRRHSDEARLESEARMRSVLENMSEGLMLFDAQQNLVFQNRASLRIHGFGEEEVVLGRDRVPVTWEAWDSTGRPVAFEEWPVSRVFRRERFQDQVLKVRRVESGQEFYGSYNGCPILDAAGSITLGFITIRDITAEVRAQTALKNNELRLRAFFESDMMGAICWNMDGRITGANDKFLGMVGYTREEVLSGKVSWAQMTPPEYRARDEFALNELRARRVDTAYEKEYVRKDGTRIPILIGAAMLDETGYEGVAFVLDNTSRRAAELAAAESQRRLDAALLAGEVGTFEWIVQEDRVWGDPNFGRLFRVKLDEDGAAPLATYLASIHPEDREDVLERINVTVTTGAPYEVEFRIVDGTESRCVIVRGMAERDSSGGVGCVRGVLMDITSRRRAEQALRESEQQFRALVESAPQLVWTARTDGAIDYVNERWCTYTGQTASEAEGTGWIAVVHPADCDRIFGRWTATAAQGDTYEVEYRLRGRDGQYRWFLTRAVALKDADGQILRWFGTTTDIDDHRRTLEALQQSQKDLSRARDELNRANAELERKVNERTAKLRDAVAELEHFSYTITHDMRAPLRAMQAFGTILRDEYQSRLDALGGDYLRRIVEASARMDALITDSLNYAKAQQTELSLEPLDPKPILLGVVESYPQFHPPRAEISIEGEFPRVYANAAGLTQCFSNLLGNAVKFVAPGISPRVRVWAEKRDGIVRLWFEDNGIGIPEDQQDRVFQMFQRLTKNYEGTGIGLALVRKVVEKMRGRVGVVSRPGGGSRFWLELEHLVKD